MGPLNQKGMFLESILNLTNNKYNDDGECVVYKIPTNYTRKNETINYLEHYALDFIGNYKGYYFEFEAKETYQQYFDWKQIRRNQIRKMAAVEKAGGLAFLIIYFGTFHTFYWVPFKVLKDYVTHHQQKIPHNIFAAIGEKLAISNSFKLDYIRCLEQFFYKKKVTLKWLNYKN